MTFAHTEMFQDVVEETLSSPENNELSLDDRLLHFAETWKDSLRITCLKNNITEELGLYPVQCTLAIGNNTFYGYQISSTQIEAQKLALIECCERWIVTELFLNSHKFDIPTQFLNSIAKISADLNPRNNDNSFFNFACELRTKEWGFISKRSIANSNLLFDTIGAASHTTWSQAIINGCLEWIEHYFLANKWNTCHPPVPVETEIPQFQLFKEVVSRHEYDLEHFAYPLGKDIWLGISTIRSHANKFPAMFIGTATDFSLFRTIERATYESLLKWLFDYLYILSGELHIDERNCEQHRLVYFKKHSDPITSFLELSNDSPIRPFEKSNRIPKSIKPLLELGDYELFAIPFISFDTIHLPLTVKISSRRQLLTIDNDVPISYYDHHPFH